MRVRQLAHDGQPQSGTAGVWTARSFDPVKRLKHGAHLLRGDAGSSVQYADSDRLAGVLAHQFDRLNAAIAQGIVQQIADDPPQRRGRRL